MKQAATILVPVDFSLHSRAATERACVLAKAFDARIRLLHALHLPPAAVDYAYAKELWADLREAESRQLEGFLADFKGRTPLISSRFEEGEPVELICAAASEAGVELIVMGSHGRRGLDRLLLGSVAERALHVAPVPLLIVREDQTQAAREIRSVLFATDFSDDARRTEQVVADWASRLGAQVEVFHVIRETAVLFAPYAVKGSSDYEAQMWKAASHLMDDCLERFQSAGVSAESKLVYGHASEEILARAEASGTQLIAMGTRGRSGLRRFRLGSVTQRVVRHAPCSVLVAGNRPASSEAPPETA